MVTRPILINHVYNLIPLHRISQNPSLVSLMDAFPALRLMLSMALMSIADLDTYQTGFTWNGGMSP